ncbi:MAG: PadR family transcriptional regulator [Acidobacteriota bacterium]|nr:PadR family transcriptional regulator [Acidobacteriota bacterium]
MLMGSEHRRDLIPGTLELMVLTTLRRRPMHGYAIGQWIREHSDDLLQIEEGTLYPALQRLLREGWVTAEWGLSVTNRRVRNYKITAGGRRQLERDVSSLEQMVKGIFNVLTPDES